MWLFSLGKLTNHFSKVKLNSDFSTLWPDEVQSAQWNKIQATIFTSVVWCQDTCKSAVAISDNLSQMNDSVITFIGKMTSELIDSAIILQLWSEGPSSQFKNNFTAAAISWLEEKYSIKLCWNLFASSHGKRPANGIEGTIK